MSDFIIVMLFSRLCLFLFSYENELNHVLIESHMNIDRIQDRECTTEENKKQKRKSSLNANDRDGHK